MNGADLFHWTLPLLATGAYVPPLLFGHSRKMINHDRAHPTNSSLSSSPQEMRTLDDSKTPILYACASCQCANVVWSDVERTHCPLYDARLHRTDGKEGSQTLHPFLFIFQTTAHSDTCFYPYNGDRTLETRWSVRCTGGVQYNKLRGYSELRLVSGEIPS